MRKHLATLAGTELHWVESGPERERAPIVLLHGLNDSHRTWSRVAPLLAQGRRVLMPDLPGHGLSGRPDAPYDLAWYARVISAWLDHLDVADVDLVGHSFGGGVAQRVLFERRERIRRLALVASGGLGREVGLGVRLMSTPHLLEKLGQPLMAPATRLVLRAGHGAFTDDEIAWLSWANAMPGTARAAARTVRGVVNFRGQRQCFLDHAHEIDLPPLALYWGDRDRIVPLSHGLTTQARTEGVELTSFMGCGHFPHQENPEHFVRALKSFLETPRARPARLRTAPRLAEAPVKTRPPSLVRRIVAFAIRFRIRPVRLFACAA